MRSRGLSPFAASAPTPAVLLGSPKGAAGLGILFFHREELPKYIPAYRSVAAATEVTSSGQQEGRKARTYFITTLKEYLEVDTQESRQSQTGMNKY